MIKKLTREELNKICDIVWWLKGFEAGTNGSFKSCAFDKTHLGALEEALRNEKELTYGSPVLSLNPAAKNSPG